MSGNRSSAVGGPVALRSVSGPVSGRSPAPSLDGSRLASPAPGDCVQSYADAVRQLTYVEPGRVEWQSVPEPEIGPTGALVRPLAVARCDLDPVMAVAGLFPGPYGIGHEAAVEVVSVGEHVSTVNPGGRYLLPFQVSCSWCDQCRANLYAGCRTYRARAGAAFGFGPAGGGHGGALSELLAVPEASHLLLRAPVDVPPALACTLPDNVIDAYRAIGPHLRKRPGADVLIVGGAAASIGLYAVAWAMALDARSVRYVDHDPERLAIADTAGAEAVAHAGPWPKRFERAPITIDNTGEPEGLLSVLRSTDDFGVCTMVAIHFEPTTTVPLLEMYTRGVTLLTSRADSRRFLPAVLEHVAAGRFDPSSVPITQVDWVDAAEAWLEPAVKLVVTTKAGGETRYPS